MVPIVKDQRSTSTLFQIESPCPGRGWDIPLALADPGVALDAYGQWIADLSRIDQRFSLRDRGIKDEVLKDFENNACIVRGADHAVGLLHGKRHRFLQGYVLARRSRIQCRLIVEMMG